MRLKPIVTLSTDPRHKSVASYRGRRNDIVDLIEPARRVLDVGCSVGTVVRQLKEAFPQAEVWGIEANPSMLEQARDLLERGFCLDLDDHDALTSALDGLYFDTVIAADVLEHTRDPWAVVRTLFDRLEPGGAIYVSLPNVAHWELLLHLLRQSWPLRERGIFDSTHLRYFMRRDLEKLVPPGGSFELLARNYRFRERRRRRKSPLPLAVGWIPWLREYFVFQYIFRIRRDESG